MFGTIPISVAFISVTEAVAVKSCLQLRCRTDEKDSVVDEVFIMNFGKKYLGDRSVSRRKALEVR